jgi:hypothetical protein
MLLEDSFGHLAKMDKFNLCVCDINIRPHLMANLIKSVAPYLYPNAKLILTLKLGRRPTEAVIRQAVIDVCEVLGNEFCGFHVKWLHSNTMNERTLFAEKLKIV